MNFKSFLFYLSLVVFISACKDDMVVDVSQQEMEIVLENSFPVIIDTFPESSNIYSNFEETPTITYPPYYFGILTDTIIIGDSINYVWPFTIIDRDLVYDEETLQNTPNHSNENYTDLFKFVYVGKPENLVKTDSGGTIKIELNKNQLIRGKYPVFITNEFEDTIMIGDDFQGVGLTMQAKIDDYFWKDIEVWPRLKCATGLPGVILAPNESVLVLAPIYKGEYITQLRLKLGEFYSKPFMGTINENQVVIPN